LFDEKFEAERSIPKRLMRLNLVGSDGV